MEKFTIQTADYDSLVNTMESIDYLNDKQKKDLKAFFAIIALPNFKGEIIYDKGSKQISIDEWKDDPVVVVILSNDKLVACLCADIYNLSEDRKMLTHYRVFETTNDITIPISCGRKNVNKIIKQIKHIDSDMELNKGKENTLSLRKALMIENIKNSLEKHYEREDEIISHFAENFSQLNWLFYNAWANDDEDTFAIRMVFTNCTLQVTRFINRSDDLTIAILWKCGWLCIGPTEIYEDYLVEHLQEFVNGELPNNGGLNDSITYFKFDEWDKERDTPKILKSDEEW